MNLKKENKKHSVWLSKSAWTEVESRYQQDNCSTRNEFIEKAIRFYSGYLDAESADEYLPRVLADVLEGKLGALGKRMGHLLFKLSVDQNLMGNILAADIEIHGEYPGCRYRNRPGSTAKGTGPVRQRGKGDQR